jgi:predicted MFS family arabinose efflux permease
VLAGFVLSDLLLTLLAGNSAFLMSEGWRIMFLVGMVPAALALPIRMLAVEPEIYVRSERGNPHRDLAPLAQTLVVMSGLWLALYAGPTYMPTFLSTVLRMSPVEYGPLLLIMNAVGIPAMIITGLLSDFVGRRTIGILGSVAGAVAAASFYLFYWKYAILGLITFGIMVNVSASIVPAYLAERFMTFSRATGIGTAYNGAFVVGGFSQVMVAAASGLIGPFAARRCCSQSTAHFR